MDRRWTWLAACAWALCTLSGCGSALIPSNLDSGITGVVLAGPQCPVIGPNSPPECQDKPLAATIIVRAADSGLEVTRFQSGEDGTFRVPLFPGAYVLDPQPGSPTGFPHAAPMDVQVQAGEFTSVTIEYDTGIR